MTIEENVVGDLIIARIISGKLVKASVENFLAQLGNFYYEGFDKIILDAKSIMQIFFNLKTD